MTSSPERRGEPRSHGTVSRARRREFRLAPRSIRDKLAIPFALVIGLIALFVSAYFPRSVAQRAEDALLARGRNVAQVAAAAYASAVADGEPDEAIARIVSTLAADDVLEVVVRDRDGSVLLVERAPRARRPRRFPRVVASVPIREASGAVTGEVQVALSSDRVHEDMASFHTTVHGVSAVIFLVGVLTLLGVGRLITNPLFDMVETAERICDGEWESRARVRTDDEIGQLAGAFNDMVDQIQATQRELESMNEDLEERVEERTRHWQSAVDEKSRVERFYQEILDTLPLEVAVFDADKCYLYLNPAAAEDYETRERMLGRSPTVDDLRQRVDPRIMTRRLAAIEEAVTAGCLVSLEERIGEGESARYFLRVFTPVLSAGGHVTRVVAYGVDITNRKQAEEALRLSEEKLLQSQKMEAVGRLAGGIAHDFNNLLTVITGHTELLLADKSAGDPDTEELDQMKRAAERAATLTRQLLAFSRRQVLQPQVLELNEVVIGVEQMLSRLIGEQFGLITTLSSDDTQVRADPGQLEQVLMNLAVNARDAMPRGGTLTIETTTADQVEALERWGDVVGDGRYVMLSVKDTGIGIPDSDRERIFEPFFTTKEVGKGTGLGLSTVYGIVRQSDGFVFVDSRVGLGTVFRIYLPEAPPSLKTPVERRVDSPPLRGGRGTILLVEDEPLVRALAIRVLERAGFHVLVASGGHEALGVLRNHAGALDLLLTDVVMPGLAGNELAERARALRPGLPVLYMSGYTDTDLLERGALADGLVLLQKPFTPERLVQVVHRALARVPTRSVAAD